MEEVNRKLFTFVMAYISQHHLPFSIKELMVFYVGGYIEISALL